MSFYRKVEESKSGRVALPSSSFGECCRLDQRRLDPRLLDLGAVLVVASHVD